jgi:hypothetical protein
VSIYKFNFKKKKNKKGNGIKERIPIVVVVGEPAEQETQSLVELGRQKKVYGQEESALKAAAMFGDVVLRGLREDVQ